MSEFTSYVIIWLGVSIVSPHSYFNCQPLYYFITYHNISVCFSVQGINASKLKRMVMSPAMIVLTWIAHVPNVHIIECLAPPVSAVTIASQAPFWVKKVILGVSASFRIEYKHSVLAQYKTQYPQIEVSVINAQTDRYIM